MKKLIDKNNFKMILVSLIVSFYLSDATLSLEKLEKTNIEKRQTNLCQLIVCQNGMVKRHKNKNNVKLRLRGNFFLI